MPPASASAVSNSSAAMQAAAAKAERVERLRGALKSYILRERQRKKEEFEAKMEEERLRREREARERQNDMTLEDTRGQIGTLDLKLTELRNQKQQLFLQLKKVLNEDESRKKLQKDSELFALQALQAQQANMPPSQVFLPPVRLQHHQMPILPKPVGTQPPKRGRTPSPPSHQGYYKNATYTTQKHDRRGADIARILWNKPPTQYQNPGTLFYQTTSNAPPPQPSDARGGPAIIYPAYNLPLRPGYHLEIQPSSTVPPVSKSENSSTKTNPVYHTHINLDQPATVTTTVGNGIPTAKPQVTMEKISDRYHVEVKHELPRHGPPHPLPDGVVYTPLIPGMPLHPNVMQISNQPGQSSKPAVSITQGYAPAAARPPTSSASSSTGSSHESQQLRQPQMTVLPPPQSGQQSQQPLHNYPRRLF